MNIFMRTDASTQTGTGHVMRCLALAEAFRDHGADVHFICRDLIGNLNGFIANKGFYVHILTRNEALDPFDLNDNSRAYDSWIEVPWQHDMIQSIDSIKKITSSADWLIIDHYAIDRRWESRMREVTQRILVIDDLADRVHDCDILLDQNYFDKTFSRYTSLVPENCQLLLGPTYALLRPEFRIARQFSMLRGNGVSRILVYFGGNDPMDLTSIVLSALCSPELEYLFVDVVVGTQNPHLEALRTITISRKRTRLYVQPEGFIELMLRADLAIGAGGTTTWERLCLNLPSIIITIAENQVPVTEQLHKAGYVRWIGGGNTITEYQIQSTVLEEINRLNDINEVFGEPNFVDGMGVIRVLETIIPSQKHDIKLRRAKLGDMETYFHWANESETRRYSFNEGFITWSDHVGWFKHKISSTDTLMWILETDRGLPVGQIRFELMGSTADINYSLDPIVRGRGWGKQLVMLGINLFKERHSEISLKAIVKEKNVASYKIFQDLGFASSFGDGAITFYLNI
jgi:UDP-2,4-diacetamido-2,4,6-trideoxy-beta-L-altropyranose hydrolase